jgi:hypothetical protein
MRSLTRAKYLAPAVHAVLFVCVWVLFRLSSLPLLDGPARVPFGIVFFSDMPISAIAFGVMFSSDEHWVMAVIIWGIVGTLWWYLLGRSIDAWVLRLQKRREKASE